MSKLEKFELLLILIAGLVVFLVAPYLPHEMTIGGLLLMASALLLLQSLIRDVSLLRLAKDSMKSSEKRTMRCMCLESTFGMTGILIGIGILSSGFNPLISLGQWDWEIVSLATLLIGFLIKDFILLTQPLRIVRDKDHLNIVFTLKS